LLQYDKTDDSITHSKTILENINKIWKNIYLN
jgi:hypothetical protein